MIRILACYLACFLGLAAAALAGCMAGQRVESDLQAIYDFEEGGGTVVHDGSRAGSPLHLHIASPNAVHWKDGALVVEGSAAIASTGPATKIISSLKQSGALSIEAWVKPENVDAERPGADRVAVGRSRPAQLHLGQDGSATTSACGPATTNENGMPSLAVARRFAHHGADARRLYSRCGGPGDDLCQRQALATKEVAGRPGQLERRLPPAPGQRADRRPAVARRAAPGGHLWPGASSGRGRAELRGRRELAGNRLCRAAARRPPIARSISSRTCSRSCASTASSAMPQGNEEGGLNLGVKSRALEGGEHGPVLVRGQSAASRLIHLVAGLEKDAHHAARGQAIR